MPPDIQIFSETNTQSDKKFNFKQHGVKDQATRGSTHSNLDFVQRSCKWGFARTEKLQTKLVWALKQSAQSVNFLEKNPDASPFLGK